MQVGIMSDACANNSSSSFASSISMSPLSRKNGAIGMPAPLANEVGVEVLSGPDYAKVKRDLAEAGYRGEPAVVLGVTGTGNIAPMSQVGVDQLRKSGLNIDLQVMDAASMSQRIMNKETWDKGGWNVHFNILEGLFNANPATNYALRADGMRMKRCKRVRTMISAIEVNLSAVKHAMDI
jgi:hypothetical protein